MCCRLHSCTADRGWLRGCKGEWSRLEYMADPRQHGIASFRQLSAVLPRSAHSLYFRDEIGNVSSSHVRHQRDKLEVVLLPRFPLFGGWSVRPVPPRTHGVLLLGLGPLHILLVMLQQQTPASQVDFVFGYSLPLSACVRKLPGGRAELTLPFSTPLKNVVVDDLTVRVRLSCVPGLSGCSHASSGGLWPPGWSPGRAA